MEAEMKRRGVLKEGLVVVLGQSMFSLPKRQWFRLGASGVFYSSRERGGNHGRAESLIEFETMYLRVEKIDEKVSYRPEKITVHCLRVGDKRKCRILCFSTWEERDMWMTSILTAIAKFKIFNCDKREELCSGKMHCNAPTSTTTLNRGRGKTTSLRFSRFGEGKSLRRRFASLRTRKSMRESTKTADFNENAFANDGRPGSGISYSSVFYKDVSASDNSDVDEATTNTRKLSESSSILSEECPGSPRIKPWLFEKLSSTVDFGMKRPKRSFSSLITKFT